MHISYQWNKKFDAKSREFANKSIKIILSYELEAEFYIESDDGQVFSENWVPIYVIAKTIKESESNLIEINLEGWDCNPFLVIEKQASSVRVKNDFIDFECDRKDYETETEQFIYHIEKDIREMGFDI